jgi:hypothetical protein
VKTYPRRYDELTDAERARLPRVTVRERGDVTRFYLLVAITVLVAVGGGLYLAAHPGAATAVPTPGAAHCEEVVATHRAEYPEAPSSAPYPSLPCSPGADPRRPSRTAGLRAPAACPDAGVSPSFLHLCRIVR